ncbi:hypothetical protein JTB14_020332 [Gonioctena quinquepunctata]|nr:hypothetical protein JTB14_020332 [Gonioctena quinquepunctata]
MKLLLFNLFFVFSVDVFHIEAKAVSNSEEIPVTKFFDDLKILGSVDDAILHECELNVPGSNETLKGILAKAQSCVESKAWITTPLDEYLANLENCTSNYVSEIKKCLPDKQYFPDFLLEYTEGIARIIYKHEDTLGSSKVPACISSLEEQENEIYNCTSRHRQLSIAPSRNEACKTFVPLNKCITDRVKSSCDSQLFPFADDYTKLIKTIIVTGTDSAKILGVFPAEGYSQFSLGEKLMSELAKRGHNVTVISRFTPNERIDNYTTIAIGAEVGTSYSFDCLNDNIFTATIRYHHFCTTGTEYVLSHKKVQELIHSNETFDLVIAEQFGNEAFMGFAVHFNAPVILLSSIGLSEWNSHLVGAVMLPSIVPHSFSSHTTQMRFLDRITNIIAHSFDIIHKEVVYFPTQQSFLDKYFPKKMDLGMLMRNVSLMLTNSHIASTETSHLPNSVVEIGGFHMTSRKLPQDMQEFLDGAESGAILFSLGTNLKSNDLPQDTTQAILRVFSKLQERVIWKYEGENIPDKPKNLMTSKWLPQNDILAHPNTIAFISHGGLMGTTEAIYHGVPIIGIPIFGDQFMNVAKSVRKGIAVHLPFSNISEDSLYEAIRSVIDNPQFRKNAKKYSEIFRDRVTDPLDLAIYWIEYVLRHEGASHLKHASADLYWFQLYLLDIWMFILSCLLLIYLLVKA